MQKGQGSLEYLIIVAAVLAIAAIVVLFLTGAFQAQQVSGELGKCKVAAASCNTALLGSSVTECTGEVKAQCESSCGGLSLEATTFCTSGQPGEITG
jgi:uncharacterized protein (UPF0333 family)